MPTLSEVRQRYPQYDDMPDSAFSDAFYNKFYSDMPRHEFDAKFGASVSDQQGDVTPGGDGQPARITVRPQGPSAPPATGAAQQIATDFMNQGSAAGQRTTPMVSAHTPNLLSSDTFENDAGEILFKDPRTGQVVPTDQNKHVALRDPNDSNVKVFARTPDTDEGTLSALGRLLATGMASGAPTRLPGGPAALPKQAPPNIGELRAAATAGYESPEVGAVAFKPVAVQALGRSIANELTRLRFNDALAPKAYSVVASLTEQLPETARSVTLPSINTLETAHKRLGELTRGSDPTERAAASLAIKRLDAYLENVPQAHLLAGDANTANAALTEARGNYAAAQHAELIDRKQVRAFLRSSAANSGQNVPNATRQRIADVLIAEKEGRPEGRGFSPDELGRMRRIVEGTKTRNQLRFVGNALGGGGGLSAIAATAAGGHIFAGLPGASAAVVPAVGWALKKLEGALVMRDVNKLSEMIRSRAPLAQKMSAPLAHWSSAAQAFNKQMTPRTFALLTISSRNLANNLRDAGITVDPRELLKAVQGPVRATSEDEQP